MLLRGDLWDYIPLKDTDAYQGLAFLHEHRIFHRVRTNSLFHHLSVKFHARSFFQDITWLNALINHLPNRDILGLETNLLRKQLRAEGRSSYALFDFNLSIMLPPGRPLSSYRLPIEECIPGVADKPWGVIWESELDFNPFAYDVGCMGVRFSDRFQVSIITSQLLHSNFTYIPFNTTQYYTPMIPMLAPLLDGMLTPDIKKRFTAAEALSFLETLLSQLDSKTLAQQPIAQSLVAWKHWDRWEGLPDEFVRQWDAYRIPQPSFQTRLLRKVCEYELGWLLVAFLRKMVRRLRAVFVPCVTE